MNNTNQLLKALMVGAGLAVAGIGLFLLVYFVILASAEDLPRLLGALFVPPAVLAVVVGGYYIASRR